MEPNVFEAMPLTAAEQVRQFRNRRRAKICGRNRKRLLAELQKPCRDAAEFKEKAARLRLLTKVHDALLDQLP
jgi:hypothetical protein